MPSILVVAPGAAPDFRDPRLLDERFELQLRDGPPLLRPRDADRSADLLVLAGLSVDEQQQTASALQEHRCWRLVPVLYVLAPGAGFAVPGTYRPEMDGLVKGTVDSSEVQQRIAGMAHEGPAAAELVVAGLAELDPLRGLLRVVDAAVSLTGRESEIMGLLMRQPGRTVASGEIIERGWGMRVDQRHLQILRRHVSNIRRKLDPTPAARAVRTVRGSGYVFDLRDISSAS
jgi:DNA-binding response OmpR family regulator